MNSYKQKKNERKGFKSTGKIMKAMNSYKNEK